VRIATVSPQDGTTPEAPEGLCQLIESLGTPDFPRRMFSSAERMLDGAAAAVYTFGGAQGTRMLIGDWRAGGAPLARHTDLYARSYAADDPARRALRDGCVVTTCLQRDELPHAGHRALLEEVGFASRVATLFPAGDGQWFGLHVLLPSRRGPSKAAFGRFSRAAPVFAARETAVCAALLRGRSSTEVAATLGIRVSSVRTYRKRAYAKLGVSSLTGLFQRLL
jgi:DNA-binding CsgD family transcriptional regulator